MRYSILTAVMFCVTAITAQKKILDHGDFDIWNTIENETISTDGAYVMYDLERGEADHFLKLRNTNGNLIFSYDRAEGGVFTYDSKYAIFKIKAWKDSVIEMKRRKVKKNKLPKDSIGIYHIETGKLQKIAGLKSMKLPEKWSGFLAYQIETSPNKEKSKDTTSNKKSKAIKKESKKNGYHLILRELATAQQDTFKFVTDYSFARKGRVLAFTTTGKNKEDDAGVYVLDLQTRSLKKVHQAKKAKYSQLALSESGSKLGFIVDPDTTKAQVRPTELYFWNKGMQMAEALIDKATSINSLRPSSYASIDFSKDESKMFFGLAKPKVIRDTSLLKEEIVNVEVWTYDEPRLYTVQEMQLKNDTVKAYTSIVHLDKDNTIMQLANMDYPEIQMTEDMNSNFALVSNGEPYMLESQWTGRRARDYAVMNVNTGQTEEVAKKLSGRVRLNPDGNFVYGYDSMDRSWFIYSMATNEYKPLTKGKVFYNERHDSPSQPSPYGVAGWTKDNRHLLIYDRYDIWAFDPNTGNSERLTRGRENRIVYRYLDLDREEEYIDTKENWLLSMFDEKDKSSGYASFNFRRKKLNTLLSGPYRYSTPVKAEKADQLLFTRQSFQEFPDLRTARLNFKNQKKISNANPQQAEYNWGTIEKFTWTSLDGIELEGMLVKPENFDPNKKYPMIVNFYEKSADGLHRHRAPSPGRSTINYSFYASRGYLIFNPDVHYRIGYPGESAFNCVIPGVTALIEKGFVDKDNIGVQGHSWGGYQIAYLVTKTDIFKAAESGAPVPNMISAYGGIRWWTGLSRQFQYEYTQSRIGGTPWEYPARFIENSPIFNIDKINTPLLIMHNDADGHVPWYQGIEFFVSLRRLGKPSWFLNYNGEPHWPLKRQNRVDFNIRMAQFFDYYLKGAPMPAWMDRGVPAMEKGINLGYELLSGDRE
ncbi:alpha/beta hydrolase family protein [Lentiprolixibacter aurantiacus]|uniref:Prolyl oligopeptidase family serine peptidase n=1 Tax=Lentiprolixibacter aurantiacus TaxID=2993939 RepID=A0AAE3MMI9_9FLAO|nr:prolyl oligopeptidase family serine peptidase [Lentiprolixibacter aurantiacus]MCX2719619.1 prolyl oligopeptidase family serine peptidase [Lentiprolixibacter aurantiacus]